MERSRSLSSSTDARGSETRSSSRSTCIGGRGATRRGCFRRGAPGSRCGPRFCFSRKAEACLPPLADLAVFLSECAPDLLPREGGPSSLVQTRQLLRDSDRARSQHRPKQLPLLAHLRPPRLLLEKHKLLPLCRELAWILW